MTNREDWTDERLASLADLPPDHPDVKALRERPELWARVTALREFLHAGAPPEGARTAEAVTRIRSAVRDALAEPATATAPPAPVPLPRATRPGPLPFWPALAAAAILIVAGALVLPRMFQRPDTFRGTESPRIRAVATVEGAEVRFRWNGVAGAEFYEVNLLHEDLSPLRPALTTGDSVLTIPISELLGGDSASRTILWRVSAVRSGNVLEGSGLERITLP